MVTRGLVALCWGFGRPSCREWEPMPWQPCRLPSAFVERAGQARFFSWLTVPCASQSLYTIHSVVVLDSEGQRIVSRFYAGDLPTLKEQKAFEASLHAKTRGVFSEIVMLGTRACAVLLLRCVTRRRPHRGRVQGARRRDAVRVGLA